MPTVLPTVSEDTTANLAPSPPAAAAAAPERMAPAVADTAPGDVTPASPSTPSPFQSGSIRAASFQPAPLPAEWVHSGNPAARSLPLTRSADGHLSSGLWDCQAGSFTYIFPCDEIVHILEGDVIVDAQGGQRHLRAGDVAFFPQGLETRWTVRHCVKKLAIFHTVTRPLHVRIAGRLLRWLGIRR
ncbi:MAG: cupin domain-containing protein [Rubrivivax sp.]|jgi:hypothetical protein|nr:cupin domain-containing protein [Rubrivivax sp.]